MKTGLVLEGGGMRGLFTSGILDVWMERGLTFDGAAGVSAGACFGCNYMSGQIGRGIRYNVKYAGNWHYKSFRSLFLTGDIFGADFCYRKLPKELDIFDEKAFAANPMEFYAVATDAEKGIPVYKLLKDGGEADMQFVRASASLPLVSRVVPYGKRSLLDGGITDSIPLKFMEGRGYERNVVILTQPEGYVKEKTKLVPAAKVLLRKFPKMIDCMAKRHLMYNEQTAYVRKRRDQGKAFVIAPAEALNIANLETKEEELRRVYNLGREAAERSWDDLQAFLAENANNL
ncbi:MAG: patatin family protein [Lachnospiraceae bacterium]|nr:patatin family protein [Lachnospiraceae bacterium]